MEKKETQEEDQICFHEVSFTDQNGELQTSKVPVVQELFRLGLQNFPLQRFQTKQNLSSSSKSQEIPPIINMGNLNSDHSIDQIRDLELKKLSRAAIEWGVFLLVDHGMSNEVLVCLEKIVKGFFDLSFEEKKKSVGTFHGSVDNMGYGKNFVKSENQTLDWIDRLAIRAAPKLDEQSSSNMGIHVWPQNPPNFRATKFSTDAGLVIIFRANRPIWCFWHARQVMEDYVDKARRVLDELLQALAEAFGLERQSFIKNFKPNESVMIVRVNYYPPCPKPESTLGIITPHSDASALTLLTQFGAAAEGLQVFKDLKWVTVVWPSNGLIVNAGDLLEIMSNGRVHSPWHRVVTRKDKERYSVAVFYNPSLNTEIEPVQGSSDVGYKKIVVQEYLDHFYRVSPTEEKTAILFAKD